MKSLNLPLNTKIKKSIQERRQKILLIMYTVCIIVLFVHNIIDIYYANYKILPIRTPMLLVMVVSFFTLYKKGAYEKASYAILLILAFTIIGILAVNKLDNFAPAFIFPFVLGAFSLFSWKKGLLFSNILLVVLLLMIFLCHDYFSTGDFLHNKTLIFNFLFVLFFVFIFGFYYETTRIDSYRILINASQTKDLLYKEIHHRVKNSLNIVSSMLAIQAENESKNVQDILAVSKNRIDAMAMVHSMLYVSNDLEKVSAKHFIEKLAFNVESTMCANVDIVFSIKELELSLNEVIPMGLIINELLTNSFKYAFTGNKNPKIIIVLQTYKDTVLLTYFDNGIGIDKDCMQNLGLKLVDLNVKQLRGNLKIYHNHGLGYKITYKRSLHV